MYDRKSKVINYIVKKGLVKHSEIIPLLNRADIQHIDPDDIVDLVKRCRFRARSGAEGFINLVKTSINRILSILIAFVTAVIFGELGAVKAFADTVINRQLKGFGDHILYWLGLKSISLTGPDMMAAVAKVVESTPAIVKAMAIGALSGFIAYEIAVFLISLAVKKITRSIRINGFIKKHS